MPSFKQQLLYCRLNSFFNVCGVIQTTVKILSTTLYKVKTVRPKTVAF